MVKHDDTGIIYYNALTVNNSTVPIRAEYSAVENYGIVQNPSQYHMAVIRFFLSARNILPIFWWQQTDDLLLPQQYGKYVVSMSYGGTVTQSRLVFRTQDLGGTPPPSSDREVNPTNAFYWSIYSHSYFIEVINSALADAYYQMSVLQPLAPPVVAGSQAPFIEMDRNDGLLSMVATRSFSPLWVGGPTVKIWMNNTLYTYMSESMRYENYYPLGNNPLGADLDFSIWVGDRGDNLIQRAVDTPNPQWLSNATYAVNQTVEYGGLNYFAIAPSLGLIPPLNPGVWTVQPSSVPAQWDPVVAYAAGNQVEYGGSFYIAVGAVGAGITPGQPLAGGVGWTLDDSFLCYRMEQDYQSLYRWIAIQRYILQGSGFTANSEILPPPGGGFSKSTQPFLIDFTPDYSSSADAAGTGSGNILYTPSAEYKRIELSGQTPLTNVQLSVSVMANNGTILPVWIGPGGSFSCKIVFERVEGK